MMSVQLERRGRCSIVILSQRCHEDYTELEVVLSLFLDQRKWRLGKFNSLNGPIMSPRLHNRMRFVSKRTQVVGKLLYIENVHLLKIKFIFVAFYAITLRDKVNDCCC